MENNSEENLSEALRLFEEGKTLPEILSLYPESAAEITGMLETAGVLARESAGIKPDEAILEKLLGKISLPQTVTNNSVVRKNNYEATKGRALKNFSNYLSTLMTLTWKTVLPVGLAAVLLIVAGVYKFGLGPAHQQAILTSADNTEFVSADVNEAVNSIIDDIDSDESLFNEETDSALANSDDQALSAFDNLNEIYEM